VKNDIESIKTDDLQKAKKDLEKLTHLFHASQRYEFLINLERLANVHAFKGIEKPSRLYSMSQNEIK
jgi:hypothetical protein